MASYSVLIKKSAAKELERIAGKKDRQRIAEPISALGGEPRPAGVERLSGTAEKYRVRQGDYRIVFELDDAAATVTIVKIGRRR
ncbi:MAG: type II toxin-antitoxin system mRNA interferase toxin, RelE/StbE family [Acidobacteria bacterium]|nr:MAG: type II toxin-antitoxin system mRNA interferase toxin, RelE/StbE family [Acidobacteriota bacterium]